MSATVLGSARLLDAPLRPDLIFDIGANRGEDSEYYLRKGFRVVAVEADAELADGVRRRLRSHLESGRLVVAEGAIVDPAMLAPGQRTVRFFKNPANPVWGTVRDDWAERNARLGAPSVTVEVEVLDLVALLQAHGIPHYMKIDIEGADLACVEALGRFGARPDYVSLESEKTSFTAAAHEVELLRALGYDAFQLVEQSTVPSQVPPDPAREGMGITHRFEEGASGLFGAELPGAWRSAPAILRQLRAIRVGHYLLGDDGVMNRWRFRGHGRLRSWAARALRPLTRGAVPGWHDLHARRAR